MPAIEDSGPYAEVFSRPTAGCWGDGVSGPCHAIGSAVRLGSIAMTFGRQASVLENWLRNSGYRPDIQNDLRAEGIHAFRMQAMSVHFCALHNATSIEERLTPYLKAWLEPGQAA